MCQRIRRHTQNYIACDADTLSEIVVPVFRASATGAERSLYAVLDVDSNRVAAFDATDKVQGLRSAFLICCHSARVLSQEYLERICEMFIV